jgi:hypothetical protein
MWIRVFSFLALLVPFLACAPLEAAFGGSDGDEDVCCPRDPVVSGCMHLGGSRAITGCGKMCDFFCSENWRVAKDMNGCEVWTADTDPTCSSGPPKPNVPDARADADLFENDVPDASSKADAEPNADATVPE